MATKTKKNHAKRSLVDFPEQPIAIVQICRRKQWMDASWIYANSKIKYLTVNFAADLGPVEAMRIKYVSDGR